MITHKGSTISKAKTRKECLHFLPSTFPPGFYPWVPKSHTKAILPYFQGELPLSDTALHFKMKPFSKPSFPFTVLLVLPV